MKQGVQSFLQSICWGVGTVSSTPRGKCLHLRYFKKDAFWQRLQRLFALRGAFSVCAP